LSSSGVGSSVSSVPAPSLPAGGGSVDDAQLTVTLVSISTVTVTLPGSGATGYPSGTAVSSSPSFSATSVPAFGVLAPSPNALPSVSSVAGFPAVSGSAPPATIFLNIAPTPVGSSSLP